MAQKSELAHPLSLSDAMSCARDAIGDITTAPLDGIRSFEKSDDEEWVAILEVIECPARMGDNDLLSAYEITLDQIGEIKAFTRVGRYHREDGAAA